VAGASKVGPVEEKRLEQGGSWEVNGRKPTSKITTKLGLLILKYIPQYA
jgi:hypothetical protein